MKIPGCPSNFLSRSGRSDGAFTLPEMMIVSAIFVLLVAALLSSQLFGMRLYQIAETKMGATADARKALNQMRTEVRSGKVMEVGTWTGSIFTNVPNNLPQVGNALRVRSTTNMTPFSCYYLDTNDNCLKRFTDASLQPKTLASFITNRLIFQAEDFDGTILTNEQNNRSIRMTLEFYRWEYPVATVGGGAMYDYFRLQTLMTRRLLD